VTGLLRKTAVKASELRGRAVWILQLFGRPSRLSATGRHFTSKLLLCGTFTQTHILFSCPPFFPSLRKFTFQKTCLPWETRSVSFYKMFQGPRGTQRFQPKIRIPPHQPIKPFCVPRAAHQKIFLHLPAFESAPVHITSSDASKQQQSPNFL
jgi:hypothetical protein